MKPTDERPPERPPARDQAPDIIRSGAPESSESNSSSCFVATAAYGSPLAEEVDVLRAARDRYLLTNRPGRWLVAAYYRLSPGIASYVATRPRVRNLVRALLGPPVHLARLLVDKRKD